MQAAAHFKQGVEKQLPELELVGSPDMCVVAVRARNPKVGSPPLHGTGTCMPSANLAKHHRHTASCCPGALAA